MRTSTRTAVILVSCCLTQIAIAEPIYRSVDKEGEVTFSDKPPSTAVDVKQVEVKPAPTEAEHKESMERAQRIENQANEMGAAHAERTPPPAQPPEEVQPTETIQYYDDGNLNQYGRARRREAIKNRLGERPVQLPAHRPAQRPAGHAAGGAGGGTRR